MISLSYLWWGTRILLIPPSLTFIFRHRFERVWGDVFITFLTWTHCVAIPKSVSPTRFTSAVEQIQIPLVIKRQILLKIKLLCMFPLVKYTTVLQDTKTYTNTKTMLLKFKVYCLYLFFFSSHAVRLVGF